MQNIELATLKAYERLENEYASDVESSFQISENLRDFQNECNKKIIELNQNLQEEKLSEQLFGVAGYINYAISSAYGTASIASGKTIQGAIGVALAASGGVFKSLSETNTLSLINKKNINKILNLPSIKDNPSLKIIFKTISNANEKFPKIFNFLISTANKIQNFISEKGYQNIFKVLHYLTSIASVGYNLIMAVTTGGKFGDLIERGFNALNVASTIGASVKAHDAQFMKNQQEKKLIQKNAKKDRLKRFQSNEDDNLIHLMDTMQNIEDVAKQMLN